MDMTETMKLYQNGLKDGSSGEFCAFIPPHLHLSRLVRAGQLIAQANPRSVLDVGCGIGMLVPHIPDGTEYLGIDLVPELVEKARGHYPGRQFEVGSHTDLSIGYQYDMVCSLGVLSHLDDTLCREFLVSLARATRKHLLIEAHNPSRYRGGFRSHNPMNLFQMLSESPYQPKSATVLVHSDDSAYQLLVKF